MKAPIMQEYILETKKGLYYKNIVTIYASGKPIEKVIETTPSIHKAKRFNNFVEASTIATPYNFKILALSTYIEKVSE